MLIHDPCRQPAPDSLGEVVYAEGWRIVRDDNDAHPLQKILFNLGRPSQREAMLAATFITWIGSVVGNEWMRAVSAAIPEDMPAYHRCSFFMSAWGDFNRRDQRKNRGFRQVELLVANQRDGDGFPVLASDLSARDYEVFDHMALWLGTDMGILFVQQCEAQIAIRQAQAGPAPVALRVEENVGHA